MDLQLFHLKLSLQEANFPNKLSCGQVITSYIYIGLLKTLENALKLVLLAIFFLFFLIFIF